MLNWYIILGKLYGSLSPFMTGLARGINLPVLTALLLGILGSTAPCQLSTNTSALGLIAQRVDKKQDALSATLAFVLGKVVVYTVLGGITILLGIRLNSLAIPVAQVVRKILGPLMLLVGIYLIGWRRFNISIGMGLTDKISGLNSKNPYLKEFFVGVVMSLAFCPTLFWLFFGMVIPLGLTTRGGIILPAIFALGTAVPLLVITSLLIYGSRKVQYYLKDLRKFNLWAQRVGGFLFILAGINDIIAYWLI